MLKSLNERAWIGSRLAANAKYRERHCAMVETSSIRRITLVAPLLCSAILLATVASVRADVVYTWTDSQPDNGGLGGSGTVAIQAQFVVSGTTINSASFSLTTANGTVFSDPLPGVVTQYGPPLSVVGNNLEMADPGWITLESGSAYINGVPVPAGQSPWMVLEFRNDSTNGDLYMGSFSRSIAGVYPSFGTTSYPSIDSNTGNWIIGSAVPEPATLALLVEALLALGGCLFVRRRAAA